VRKRIPGKKKAYKNYRQRFAPPPVFLSGISLKDFADSYFSVFEMFFSCIFEGEKIDGYIFQPLKYVLPAKMLLAIAPDPEITLYLNHKDVWRLLFKSINLATEEEL